MIIVPPRRSLAGQSLGGEAQQLGQNLGTAELVTSSLRTLTVKFLVLSKDLAIADSLSGCVKSVGTRTCEGTRAASFGNRIPLKGLDLYKIT